ncbi:MAG: CPBP family glutamic-type intramembrane protease [Vulcanimicrobiaceae bacterium]
MAREIVSRVPNDTQSPNHIAGPSPARWETDNPRSKRSAVWGIPVQTSINSTSLGQHTFLSFRLDTLISAFLSICSHFLLLIDQVAPPRVRLEVLSALLLALVTGDIYQRTSNLWYGIILHALGNLGGV